MHFYLNKMQNDKKETSHKNTNSDVDDDIKIEKPSYTYWKRDSDMNADHTGFQPQPTNEHPENNTNKIGSTCFVIDSSKYYMLNSKFQWIEIFPFGTSSSSGDSSGPDDPPDDVIYEGGVI